MDNNAYLEAWRQKMVEIWKDRIDMLDINNTGALHHSVTTPTINAAQTEAQITFQFLQYGIYVDRGVGNGYRHNNGGKLHFLDKNYRQQHHLTQPRAPRPWFSTSYFISTQVLKSHLARRLGNAYVTLFDNLDTQ